MLMNGRMDSATDYIKSVYVNKEPPVIIELRYSNVICRGVELSEELFDKYYNLIDELMAGKEYEIEVVYDAGNSLEVDLDYIKSLKKMDNYIQEKTNSPMLLNFEDALGKVTIESVVNSTIKLNNIVDRVKNATNNGAPLSVFEKYMLIYDYVTDFVYNQKEESDGAESRNWIFILEKGEIVCVGYHQLLEKICNKVFSPEELSISQSSSVIYDKNGKLLGNHQSSLVYMNDPKYDIKGLMHSDACWDSVDKKGDKRLNHCCVPLSDMLYSEYMIEFCSHLARIYLRGLDDYAFKDVESNDFFSDSPHGLLITTNESFDSNNVVYADDFIAFKSILPELKQYDFADEDGELLEIFGFSVPLNKKEIDNENEEAVMERVVEIFEQTKTPSITAYISALEVVASVKGYNEEQTEEYIERILSSSFDYGETFDSEKCKSPFAAEYRVTYAQYKEMRQQVSR